MVSTLQEQVQAELIRLRDQRDTEVLKELTKDANDFKVRWSAAPRQGPRRRDHGVEEPDDEDGLITGSPSNYGPKALKLAAALSQAAYMKSEDRRKLVEAKQNDQDREVVLKSAIVSASTKDDPGPGKRRQDFGKQGPGRRAVRRFLQVRPNQVEYNTSASKDSDLLAGASEGACGTFSFQLARLINLVVRKKVAKSEMVSARNFITVPLKTVQFIDSHCPGNLKMGKDADPIATFTPNIGSVPSVAESTVRRLAPRLAGWTRRGQTGIQEGERQL